jgi:hypothetical protein
MAIMCRTSHRHPLVVAATPPVEVLGPDDIAGFASD